MDKMAFKHIYLIINSGNLLIAATIMFSVNS